MGWTAAQLNVTNVRKMAAKRRRLMRGEECIMKKRVLKGIEA
jgi:hypothetical protein